MSVATWTLAQSIAKGTESWRVKDSMLNLACAVTNSLFYSNKAFVFIKVSILYGFLTIE